MGHVQFQKSRLVTWISIVLFLLTAVQAYCVRIKDIAEVEGVRENNLIGYGLVVGLDGTGDDKGTQFTIQSLVSYLQKEGIYVDLDKIDVENVAGVLVTATLPPFAKAGTTIDVLVSSIGDAESLQGGTLLMTPLKGPDGKMYAVAQGAVSIGGFSVAAGGTSIQKNHPTVGQIPGGATIERSLPFDLLDKESLNILLRNPDFTTAQRIANAVNSYLGREVAQALDSCMVFVLIPPEYTGDVVRFLACIETLEVSPDTTAKIVINERTGTVIMGSNVRLSTIAISHGNLSIQISAIEDVSQPLPFSEGETLPITQTAIVVEEEGDKLTLVEEGVTISEVVRALNALGVSPRDLIAIFQAIKASGSLQAELEII